MTNEPIPETPPTPAAMVTELLRLSRRLDDANDALKTAGREWAHAENEYRKAKANAFVQSKMRAVGGKHPTDSTVNAMVDQSCEHERLQAHLAESEKVAALQLVRSLQTQLSAFQTTLNALRSEMDMAGRHGP